MRFAAASAFGAFTQTQAKPCRMTYSGSLASVFMPATLLIPER